MTSDPLSPAHSVQEYQVFRAQEIPPLPESPRKRGRVGQILQPVGDYADIEPYYRVCEDAEVVQGQKRDNENFFRSDDWWWDAERIQFLTGKAHVILSAVLLAIPDGWTLLLFAGGGLLVLGALLNLGLPDDLETGVLVITALAWLPLSLYVSHKTYPLVMIPIGLVLKPFSAFQNRLLTRILDSGRSEFNRRTGRVSFAMGGGRTLTAQFVEFDAYVERLLQPGGIFYRLMFIHRYTGKMFPLTSLGRIEPTKEEVMALWDMLQRYMDVSRPLPDVPRLETFRHMDPVTAEHDERTGRDPRFWRDLDLTAWEKGEGAQWLKRQAEYPWDQRTCLLTPQLGRIPIKDYRQTVVTPA